MAPTARSPSRASEGRAPDGALRLPLGLTFRPSRLLYCLCAVGAVGAAVVLWLLPDRWGVAAAAILLLSAASLAYWNSGTAGRRLVLLEGGRWLLGEGGAACMIEAGSADLGGTLWLHGREEGGRRRALMVLPDALVEPQGRRWLRVWFHQVAAQALTTADEPLSPS